MRPGRKAAIRQVQWKGPGRARQAWKSFYPCLFPVPAVLMSAIYLDNNATTPLLPAVWEAMLPFFAENYGNPASSHWAGRAARRALEDAREKTAVLLEAYPDEVVFTSGATEANNLALFGLSGKSPAQIVTSPIEHPSVAEPVAQLARRGFSSSATDRQSPRHRFQDIADGGSRPQHTARYGHAGQ